ncbi:MAG TPA: cytochrome c oxidase assembly protein [Actinomycetota bacterium]|nr:cytochrome c oxidase assembly protein [Actinomycetota bacterium]
MPSFHVHPDVVLLLGGLWAAYLVAVRHHREGDPSAAPGTARKTVLFSIGMLALLAASTWPIHDLAEERLYAAHMLQHMVYTLVAPPLLIAGIPVWMWRAFLRVRAAAAVFRFLVRPLVALLFFNGVLLFTHWPAVVEASVGSELLHFSLHVLIVGSGLVMWWPVMSPVPELPSLSPPGQMMYLFFQSLAPTIPASFLTFGHSPLYAVYATFPRIWGIAALEDQLIAGLLMKLGGGLILWGFIASIWFRWYARDSRDGFDTVGMSGLERDVRTGLMKS